DCDGLAVSFRSALVGIEHGKYLLLKSPGQLGEMDHDIFKGEDLIIKSLYKGTIYAFRSRLISIISKPSNLIFIEYPQLIEHHELRSHKRFKCNIVTQTKINQKERGGVIENISIGGCLCIIQTFLTESNSMGDLLKNAIPFRCHFPGSKGEVNFQGEIRNTQKKSGELVVGIKFIYPDSTNEVQSIIDNYIHLIESSSENV
ncbi:MAG: flagellar brake protein, partial [Desulfobacula sp.]|nr:flagellar brake protein [Desulfobacula sp.]